MEWLCPKLDSQTFSQSSLKQVLRSLETETIICIYYLRSSPPCYKTSKRLEKQLRGKRLDKFEMKSTIDSTSKHHNPRHFTLPQVTRASHVDPGNFERSSRTNPVDRKRSWSGPNLSAIKSSTLRAVNYNLTDCSSSLRNPESFPQIAHHHLNSSMR
ncbi:unnamed protein product [Allacma fusca]|uniref:Uncharacterized protein n=1 Tax=Allacma fusca TaxID=39272 RepID=A0A8J2LFQ5_9HEXA|nr:unnamed protein product [Allacma fusca]